MHLQWPKSWNSKHASFPKITCMYWCCWGGGWVTVLWEHRLPLLHPRCCFLARLSLSIFPDHRQRLSQQFDVHEKHPEAWPRRPFMWLQGSYTPVRGSVWAAGIRSTVGGRLLWNLPCCINRPADWCRVESIHNWETRGSSWILHRINKSVIDRCSTCAKM